VDYFDIDKNGRLSYSEFLQMILPCDDLFLRSTVTQREACSNFDPRIHTRLHPRIEKALTVLLEREIDLHVSMTQLRRKLHELPQWNPRLAFDYMLGHDLQFGDALSHSNF
jgi:hypothetical protein